MQKLPGIKLRTRTPTRRTSMPKAQDRLVKDRSRVRERRLPDAPETPCGCRTADVACAKILALFLCSSAQVARRRQK